MKKILCLLFLLFCGNAWGSTCSTPSSSYTYISGQVILPNQVQTNENNLYTYVQSGVCNYQAGSISESAVSPTAGILYSQLNLSGGILPTDINTNTTTSIYTFQNIETYAPHLGDILYDNGTQFVRLPEGTAGTVLKSQGSSSAPIYGFPSGQFGSWSSSNNFGTVYQAATDGIVISSLNGGSQGINFYTDSNSTPSTLRGESYSNAVAFISTVTCPVRKGDYYEATSVEGGGSAQTVYFLPVGS